nr:histone-lysine N-methyltransferase SETD1A-like [Ipomoea batatas]
MADAVTNMIVRLLNTNDSPEDALKLVTQFLSIAVQRKLKLDPKLINEIISTVIHNFSEFVDQLEIEDATKLFSIAITFHYYQLYDLPINPIIAEKDFIATPSYFIKPKTIQELPGDVEMSEADDVPTKPIIELSSSELKRVHAARPVNSNSLAFLVTVLLLFMILNSHQLSPNFHDSNNDNVLNRPKKSRSLDDAAVKVSVKEYEYEIFRSPEEYQKANLEPPKYDLPEKYTPQRAAVTVAVKAPLPETSSRGTMRSFPVSARPPAPAKKISLGSKKTEPSGDHGDARTAKRGKEKETDEVEEVAPAKRSRRDGSGSTTPVIDVLMKHGDKPPAALLSRICAAAPPPKKTSGWSTALVGERIACDLIQDGDEIHRREVAPLKKALAKRDQRIKQLEGKLKTAEETGRRILERADLGEKILTDPVLLARHICRGRETGEAVLAAISRTPVGEDLMYEFGTWAFNSGRRAMQNDVKTALEVAMDEADLPNILAVLPEEVPDPGPTPFSSVPEGRNLPVPVVEVSARPSAEAAATTGPMTESRVSPSAGPSAEGDAEPRVDSGKEAN